MLKLAMGINNLLLPTHLQTFWDYEAKKKKNPSQAILIFLCKLSILSHWKAGVVKNGYIHSKESLLAQCLCVVAQQ